MGKKKNKIPKLTEDEYFAYISGLKGGAAGSGESVKKPDGGNVNKNK
ncbi:MAG: hypothetical protein HFE41_02285 [Clostridia bacterium]|mgnify:CR=1 FL=1|jgi:hypothetical protein|nr:hypothetical protein [Clostridia bacterium]